VEITVTGRHPSITQAMRSYAEEKIRKVGRIFDRLVSARVTLEVEGMEHRAEASVHGPRGAVLVAHATAPEMAEALDQLENRLERQLRKLKTKIEGQRLLRA
jgi:putative sigma-54 modulation protein